jgi:hypothetical protein
MELHCAETGSASGGETLEKSELGKQEGKVGSEAQRG